MRSDLEASGAEAVIVIAAEHFANFFMNNMPSFAIGMADFSTDRCAAWRRVRPR